jgi:hypothetical protein
MTTFLCLLFGPTGAASYLSIPGMMADAVLRQHPSRQMQGSNPHARHEPQWHVHTHETSLPCFLLSSTGTGCEGVVMGLPSSRRAVPANARIVCLPSASPFSAPSAAFPLVEAPPPLSPVGGGEAPPHV